MAARPPLADREQHLAIALYRLLAQGHPVSLAQLAERCSQLRAVNLRGTGNVEHDHREITLEGPHGPVRVRIAALAGYLLSKAAAARTRGADKDYYDLAYVLLHNHAGGPAAAAAVVNASSSRRSPECPRRSSNWVSASATIARTAHERSPKSR